MRKTLAADHLAEIAVVAAVVEDSEQAVENSPTDHAFPELMALLPPFVVHQKPGPAAANSLPALLTLLHLSRPEQFALTGVLFAGFKAESV